jgi:hypothetical protein
MGGMTSPRNRLRAAATLAWICSGFGVSDIVSTFLPTLAPWGGRNCRECLRKFLYQTKKAPSRSSAGDPNEDVNNRIQLHFFGFFVSARRAAERNYIRS